MIKGICISIFLLLLLFLVSCTNLDNYVSIEDYNRLHNNFNAAIDDYGDLKEDNAILKNENRELEKQSEETEKYKYLLSNLNDLLSNVYYGYASNSNWESDGFTAFSIRYKDKFYIITAGHAVHYIDDGINTGVYTYFKFKANFDDEWVYPELLTYENDFYNNRDYAILYSDKINSGLSFDLNNTFPKYTLGNKENNIFKEHNAYNSIEGESGSPIIDIDGEVMGIATGSFTDIDLVIEAIDILE